MALAAILLRLFGYALGTAGTLMILAHKGGKLAYLLVLAMVPAFLISQGMGLYLRMKRKPDAGFSRMRRPPAA